MDRTRARARRLRSNSTDAEMKLWQFLRRRQLAGFRFRRQVPLAGFIADFACLEKNLIVELDGGKHVARARYDAQRTEALEVLGYRVLRYWNDAVMKQMPEVLEDILRALEER